MAATATALALALTALRDLRGWEPVEALAERVTSALRGEEGLGRLDLQRLKTWPERWSQVRPEVQRFYREILNVRGLEPSQEIAVRRGLWAVLEGVVVESWVSGQLSRLHREHLGEEAGWDLCARAQSRRTR